LTDISSNTTSSNYTLTLPAITATIATLSGTESLTNKTIVSPVITNPTGIVSSDIGLGNVNNTADADKPVSTLQQAALDLKEVLTNKSINVTTDAASDSKYPSVKAVKTYVDSRTGAVKTYGVISLTAGVTKPVLPFDFNTVQKNNTSNCVLPTTTEIGKEVIFFATGYAGTVSLYANEAETARLQGLFSNGVSGASGALTINPNEAYRFISLASGYWYCERIIDISTPIFQSLSERSIDGAFTTNSDFKYPTEKAVKTYVDNKTSVAKTKGNLSGSDAGYLIYTELIYDINLIQDGSTSSFFKLPNTTTIGKEIIIDVRGTNCSIYGFTPGDTAFETNVNGASGQLQPKSNNLIRLTSIATNFWLVEFLQRETALLPGTQTVKVVKTTITSAQVLQLSTTPITILNSNNPLTIAYPTNIYIKRKPGTPYTLVNNLFQVINDVYTVLGGNLNPNPLQNTEGFFQSAISTNQNISGTGVYKNTSYKLSAATGDPVGGTGDLDVYVTYVEITL
jgi:hypothetical protein